MNQKSRIFMLLLLCIHDSAYSAMQLCCGKRRQPRKPPSPQELYQTLLAPNIDTRKDKDPKQKLLVFLANNAQQTLHLNQMPLLSRLCTKANQHWIENMTQLDIAFLDFDVEVAQRMLKHGANVDQQDKAGNTTLHNIARTREFDGHWHPDSLQSKHAFIACLLEHRANVNTQNNNGDTPAMATENIDILRALINAKADLALCNNNREDILTTPLVRDRTYVLAMQKIIFQECIIPSPDNSLLADLLGIVRDYFNDAPPDKAPARADRKRCLE